MKVKIDTDQKIISLEQTVEFGELYKFLKSLFPNDYKQWKVETNVKFEITSSPIIIRDYYPWTSPFYYYTNNPWTVPTAGTVGTVTSFPQQDSSIDNTGNSTTTSNGSEVYNGSGVYYIETSLLTNTTTK